MKRYLFPLLLISCANDPGQRTEAGKAVAIAATEATVDKNDTLPAIDELTMGALRLKEGATGSVILYNGKGMVTDSIVLADESEPRISPWAIKTDYGILVFRVLTQNDTSYQVIADEKLQRIAYVKKKDTLMEFQRWDEHMLKTFSIEVDLTLTPLREKPADTAAIVDPGLKVDEIVYYHPVTTQGEWLQVSWGADERKAWVRWRKGNKLLVNWFYMS